MARLRLNYQSYPDCLYNIAGPRIGYFFFFFFFFLVSGTPGHNAGYPIYLRLFTYIHWFTEYNNKNAF